LAPQTNLTTAGGPGGGEAPPPMPDAPIFLHGAEYAGRTAREKLGDVRAELAKKGADCCVVCGLEDVAWLLNVRGGDIRNTPVAYAFCFVAGDGATLYIDPSKAPPDVAGALAEDGVSLAPPDALYARLAGLPAGTRLLYDPRKLNCRLFGHIPAGVERVAGREPTVALKAVKNATEIARYRECQARDGAAMARFLMWAEGAVAPGKPAVTEWDASAALAGFRAASPMCRGDSFDAIVAYGPNGAMMHYAPQPGASAELAPRGLMVVDSGGQYPDGTTDVTRTLALGPLTDEERRDFTLTLKSHIALASARFLYGATGPHLDSIARKVMWDNAMDYKCGTGHGVGYYLSVHEGPQSLSMRPDASARLEEGMVVSIEPGVYRAGKHGVRIENLARVRFDLENEFGRFLRFEMLSFCPIARAAIDRSMLEPKEAAWLDEYHRATYDAVAPLLGEAERAWLAEATRPL